MKAIALHQPWAAMIAGGEKTIETRTWATDYRGPLVICSTKRPEVAGCMCGHALAIAELLDCRPMTDADETAACCCRYEGARAWVLGHVRKIEPFAVRGRQRLFEVDLPDLFAPELHAGSPQGEIPNPQSKGPTMTSTNDVTEAEKLANILAVGQRIEELSDKIKDLRGQLKDHRDWLKTARDELAQLMREAAEGLPLYGQGATCRVAMSVDTASEAELAEIAPGEAGDGEAVDGGEFWRDVPLADLPAGHIPLRIRKALAENDPPITTVGDWTDWVADKGDFAVKDVKGLGAAAAETIDEALQAFWAHRAAQKRQAGDETTDEAASEADVDEVA